MIVMGWSMAMSEGGGTGMGESGEMKHGHE